jgi:hypothetical protein
VNHWNRRIALAAVLAAFSAPALAADPAKDCTVCSDPTWPNLDNLMPGIGLNGPAETGKRPSPGGVAPWLAANYQSPGVGVAASDVATGSVYSDPTWPQMRAPAAGMAASQPATPAPAPRAEPARTTVAAK